VPAIQKVVGRTQLTVRPRVAHVPLEFVARDLDPELRQARRRVLGLLDGRPGLSGRLGVGVELGPSPKSGG
jgi:hypothetical protein